MRYKNIHVHIDAPAGSGKYEAEKVIKEALEAAGAHVELRYPDKHMHKEEELGFSETTVFIDMHVPKDLNI